MLEQWVFKITAYADELLKGLDTLTDWPRKSSSCSELDLGAPKGARITFPVDGGYSIEVFTTIDTIYGARPSAPIAPSMRW